MKYDTIIFDMDGTLLNTLEDLAGSVNHVMQVLGYEQQSLDKVRLSVGNGATKLMERVLPGGREDPFFDRALKMHETYYEGHCRILTRPYEGIIQALQMLRGAGAEMAIVSNKGDGAVRELARQYFPDIPVAVGAREGIRKKPCPDTVLEALRLLHGAPERALYVGDSEVDHATAHNAGMDCMLVGWGFRERSLLESLKPEYLVDTPEQMQQVILSAGDSFGNVVF